MGITYFDASAYWAAEKRGVTFQRTMTLGHQSLYLHSREVAQLRKHFATVTGRQSGALEGYDWGEKADAFLREFLGVSELTVMDASSYEGADTIHDMNLPVPEEWHQSFDAIIDCGSLEHIFNVPMALRNLAHLLAVGGTLFISTPANNLMGHGFYQFSPELMFRVFSAENGFAIRSLTLREARFPSVELTRSRRPYIVGDPQRVGKRVGLMSKRPAVMMVEAVKIADVDFMANAPQQSDYAATWTGSGDAAPKSALHRSARRVLDALPHAVSARIRGRRQQAQYSLRNSEFFHRLSRDE